ncbi:hypothetical protein MMC08_008195, partial [Hypocenomyce scalaris]|nr:hypothetical protein [Hypocenomyce scalaris]
MDFLKAALLQSRAALFQSMAGLLFLVRSLTDAPNGAIFWDPLNYLVHKSSNYHTVISNVGNVVANVNFQVCASGTFDHGTVNPWSVYPVAKACLEVPWVYAVAFWALSFL